MKLEQNDKSFIFSTTELPDVFFTEYLSHSNSDYIKVYLYIIFLSKYNKDVKINDLSKKLELPLKTIQEAIKYWEDIGALTKKSTGYLINSLQEIELHKLYNPKVALSAEEIKASNQNQYRAKAIENINNTFFQGVMSPSWYSDIDLWFKKYSFDEEVMVALFQYCFNRSALHRQYIQTVADSWYRHGIKTFNDLDKHYEKQEKLHTLSKTISKKLGISRNLSQYEEAYIERWNMEFGYNLDVIEIALKKTTSKANPSFDYLDKLLTDWHDRNFKTADEVQTFLSSMKQKNKDIQKLNKTVNFQNYEQRNYKDLENLYINSIQRSEQNQQPKNLA